MLNTKLLNFGRSRTALVVLTLAFPAAASAVGQERPRGDAPILTTQEQSRGDFSGSSDLARPVVNRSVPLTHDWTRNDGSLPMVVDWSNKHVVYPVGYTQEQYESMQKDPRAYANWYLHGLLRRPHGPSPNPNRISPVGTDLKRDWAVSLGGTAGVAAGMSPAKYVFDVNATPSCPNDYAAFPVNAVTGNTRTKVVGTFSAATGGANGGTVLLSVTPTGQSAVTLTLTASTSSNSGLNFQVFTTASAANADTEATNLAEAINRNLSNVALGKIVGVAAAGANTVTVYALTPGTRITMAAPTVTGEAALTFGTVTAGTNGTQANIVAFNNLYAGAGTPLCTGDTFPTFIFSYASGVGAVATSPTISIDGTKIAYVENDANIGAILHILTHGSGATEYGTCTNSGTALPTCAGAPVIPGSTANSTATDNMLPLGLVGRDGVTGAAGSADLYSSPFVNYSDDTLYVGDGGGFLYSITPVFVGSNPAHAGGSFPLTVSAGNALNAPVVDIGGTGNIFVGDSTGVLHNYNSGGTAEGTIPVGNATAGGVRDGVVIDSTNAVGYAVSGCNADGDSVINQFSFTGTSIASKALAELDAEGCTGAIPLYAPSLDNNYYSKGISSATAANNGEVQVGYAHSGHSALNQYQFTSGAMGTTAQFDDEFNTTGALTFSPTVEFYSNPVGAPITAVAQTTTTVTITAANTLAVNDLVSINGVSSGSGGCSATAAGDIDGTHVVVSATGTNFTFTAVDSATITTGSCTLATPTATLVGYAVTGITQAGTTVTVTTPTNAFTAGQTVVISGVSSGTGGCTAGPAAAIDGEQTVLAAGTPFTFTSTQTATITAGQCTLSSAESVGPTQDYVFFGITLPEVLTFKLPLTSATQAAIATNTTDATGGTSGMVVDNDSGDGQAASTYFSTEATSATLCGGTAAFCAIKLTQSGLN
jgi:hypothetical protein